MADVQIRGHSPRTKTIFAIISEATCYNKKIFLPTDFNASALYDS